MSPMSDQPTAEMKNHSANSHKQRLFRYGAVVVLVLAFFTVGLLAVVRASSHSITSITPAEVIVGTKEFSLRVDGENFVKDQSEIHFDHESGTPSRYLTTDSPSTTRVIGVVRESDISKVGTVTVTVDNNPPGGDWSTNSKSLIIKPLPVDLAPDQTVDLGASGTLTLTIGARQVADRVFNISTDNTQAVNVPASVTVPSGTLTVTVPFSTGTAGGVATVFASAADSDLGTETGSAVITVRNPDPTISELSPTTAKAGGEAFTMVITGTNFVETSQVLWVKDGVTETLAPNMVSPGRLEVSIPPSATDSTGSVDVYVRNPTPGGGTSNGLSFTVEEVGLSFDPTSLTLEVYQTGTLTLQVDQAQAADREVTLASSSAAVTVPSTVTLPAGATSVSVNVTGEEAGNATVTAALPPELSSQQASATVTVVNPVPVLDSISPKSETAGSPGFPLTLEGNQFLSDSIVWWKFGTETPVQLTVSSSSKTELVAQVTDDLVARHGTVKVWVENPGPGGGPSTEQTFTIDPLGVTLTPDPHEMMINATTQLTVTISAPQATARDVSLAADSLLVVPASVTIPQGQTYISFTVESQSQAGTAVVTATLPADQGGQQDTATVTVKNPAPTLNSIDPVARTAGTPTFQLTLSGENFVGDSRVWWQDGGSTTPVTLTVLSQSSTQLVVEVPDALVENEGSAEVWVENPTPGGGTSGKLPFTIEALGVTLTPADQTLQLNRTGQLTVTISAAQAADRTITLESSDPAIASVPSTVLIPAGDTWKAFDVTAGSTTGTAIVTATVPAAQGGEQITATINVHNPQPSITGLDPLSKTAGEPGFELTVSGANFVNGAGIEWNGASLTTSFVNSTTLTTTIDASLINSNGTADVTVVNPAPGGGESAPATFTIDALGITLTPADQTLELNQTGQLTATISAAQAADRTITLESSDPAIASVPSTVLIPAGDTWKAFNVTAGSTAGTAIVTATVPAAQGGEQITATINVRNPQPVLDAIDPTEKLVGDPAFSLTLTGTNFISNSKVWWQYETDSPVTLTVSSQTSTQLIAEVPAGHIDTDGHVDVWVENPGPGGGFTVKQPFTITNPTPTISSINPGSAVAGTSGFTLTVSGSGFNSDSTIYWNGQALTTTTYDEVTGDLSVSIDASRIHDIGTAEVTVVNPTPGGGTSTPVTFNITAPTITLDPDNTIAVYETATVSITIPADHVQVGDRIITLEATPTDTLAFLDGTQVTLPAGETSVTFRVEGLKESNPLDPSDTTVTGTLPDHLGASSETVLIKVQGYLPPTIDGLNPAQSDAGVPGFDMTITGDNFVEGITEVYWKAPGDLLPGTQMQVVQWISRNELIVRVTATMVEEAGQATVSVQNPGTDPYTATFQINAPTITMTPDPVELNTSGDTGQVTLTISSAQAADREITLNLDNPAIAAVPGSVTLPANETTISFAITSTNTTGDGRLTATLPALIGGNTDDVQVQVKHPQPVIDPNGFNPASVVAGSPTFTLTITGSNFIADADVIWTDANGVTSTLATTFVDSTTLKAVVTDTLIASPGINTVKVKNPDPSWASSAPVEFVVEALALALDEANNTTEFNSTVTLTATINAPQAGPRTITLTSDDTAIATVPGSVTIPAGATSVTFDVTTHEKGGTATLTGKLPAEQGGNTTTATVTVNNPQPAIGSLNPSSAKAGTPGFTLTVNGTNFVPGANVLWNGQALPTTFVDTTQLQAEVDANQVVAVGTYDVTVQNPVPGGGTSAPVPFTVEPLGIVIAPSALAIDPGTNGTFTITVDAAQTADRTITLVSSDSTVASVANSVVLPAGQTSVSFSVTAGADKGQATVTATLPADQGGASASADVLVNHPGPVIGGLDPASRAAGTPGFTLTVNGNNFVADSVVHWNGEALPTTFTSETQLQVEIDAARVAAPGSAEITVVSPDAQGGTSNAVTFQITPPVITLTPASSEIVVGTTGTLTVSIDAAQASDREIKFVSADPSIASVPASVILPAGATEVSIDVTGEALGGPVTITATLPADVGGGQATANVTVVEATDPGPSAPGAHLFLPHIMRRPAGPDLAATLQLSPDKTTFEEGEPVTIEVLVTNHGNEWSDGFWVDFYIDPVTVPSVNKRWDMISDYGIVWEVPGLAPGESVLLTSTPGNYAEKYSRWNGYFLGGQSELYVFLDSWHPDTTYGAVKESDETNNLVGPYNITVQPSANTTTLDHDGPRKPIPERPAPGSR